MSIARPRVLLVTWGCDPDDVSEPQVAARWCRELIDRGMAARIISVSKRTRHGVVRSEFGSKVFAELKDLPIPGLIDRVGAIAKPGTVLLSRSLRAEVERCIRQDHIELVHQLNPFGWRFGTCLKSLNVPLVRGPVGGGVPTPDWHFESASRRERLFELARRLDEKRCRHSSRLRSSMASVTELLVAADYLRDIPALQAAPNVSVESEHGVASTEIAASDATPLGRGEHEPLRLLFAGRLIRSKGPLLALEAVSRLPPDVDWRLDLAGMGPLEAELKARANALNLLDRINMLGWVSHRDVLEKMRSSHVFLFPSYREPSGGVVVEAFAQGVPVITADAGGPATLVDEAVGCKVSTVSKNRMIEDLAEKIELMYRDEIRRRTMAAAALKKCRDIFSWDRKAERIEGIYARAVELWANTKSTT